jgi:hypothetical protein
MKLLLLTVTSETPQCLRLDMRLCDVFLSLQTPVLVLIVKGTVKACAIDRTIVSNVLRRRNKPLPPPWK